MNTKSTAESHLSGYYTPAFYFTRLDGSLKSAKAIVPLILGRLSARSVIDVGCGTGAWLAVFSAHGVAEIHGVDGNHVNRSMLDISPESFTTADLSLPLKLDRRYDLAICMEVGEHLPEASARILVQTLVGLANVVLFSAAPPGQGGMNHINEQWPDYWAKLFQVYGYRSIDCIRPEVWNNSEVDWWYAQNSFVYASEEGLEQHPNLGKIDSNLSDGSFHLVHPKSVDRLRAYLTAILKQDQTLGIRWCARAFVMALKNAVARRLFSSPKARKEL